MTLVINEQAADWTKYECMLTCGRVLISSDLRSYALRCKFCATICLRPKLLVTHISEQHMDTVKELYIKHLQDVDDDGVAQTIALEYVEALPQYESAEEVTNSPTMQTDFVESTKIGNYNDETQNQHESQSIDDEYLSDCDEYVEDDDECSIDLTTMGYNVYIGENDADIDLNDISKRTLFLRIIERFKAKPELWNNEDKMFAQRHHKRVLLKNIAGDLNDEFDLNLTPLTIRQIFMGLRRLFYAEEQMRQNQMQTDIEHNDDESELWCYEALCFLKQTKLKSQISLPEKMKLLIARHYKTNSLLWNREHKDYHNRAQRKTILQQIVNELNAKQNDGAVELTLHQLLLCMQRLRIMCTANKQARMQSRTTKAKYKPPYPAYVKPLSFLNDYIGPFECEVCGATTLNYNRHKTHENTHNSNNNNDDSDNTPYTCDYCGKVLKNSTTLRLHKRTHTGEMPYECTVCNRKFTNSGNLRVHRRVHTGERPYICDVCGKTFRTCSFLLRHKLYHNPENFRFKCSICEKAFGEKKRLREHMNSHLNRREFLCDFCGKGFYARKTLRQHEQLHNTSKSHSCEICGVTFAQRAGLYSHMKRTHRTLQLKGNDVELSPM